MDGKTANRLKIAIKVAIVVLAYAYAGYRIATAPDIYQLPTYFSEMGLSRSLVLVAILLLMPINWTIETWKWQMLVRSTEPNIGFDRCLKAVMSGVTVGTLTPNRAGEFAGRILFVQKENRAKVSYLTIFGDTAQFCATVIFGIIGLLTIGNCISEAINFNTLMIISAICGIAIIIIFIEFDKIINAIGRIKFIRTRFDKYVPQCEIGIRSKVITLILSIARYAVFCLQFYLSLRFFGIDIPMQSAFAAIFATYICTYLIPSIAAAELGIRVSFAILFIGIFTTQETAIALASLLLYLVNVGIPIAIGGIFLLKEKK